MYSYTSFSVGVNYESLKDKHKIKVNVKNNKHSSNTANILNLKGSTLKHDTALFGHLINSHTCKQLTQTFK